MDKTGMKVVRTPDSCFNQLKDFPFEPRYVYIDGIRMHYIDENSPNKPVVVMLHGEPAWAYIFRKMVHFFTDEGFRVVVPDMIGFGKSDKPTEKKAYSYPKSVAWMEAFLFKALHLSNIHFIVHDWGGLIGLRIVANYPERFDSVVALNTAFPRSEGFNPIFYLWRHASIITKFLPFSKLIPLGTFKKLDKEVLKGYDAPFPDNHFKVAPLRFPKLVPLFPWEKETRKNKEIWGKLKYFKKPFLTIFSDKDPFTKHVAEQFIGHVEGANHQPHLKVKNARHFIQEDQPELISKHIIRFIKDNKL